MVNIKAMILTGEISFKDLDQGLLQELQDDQQIEVINWLFSDLKEWFSVYSQLTAQGKDRNKLLDNAFNFVKQASSNPKFAAVFQKIISESNSYASRSRSYHHRSYRNDWRSCYDRHCAEEQRRKAERERAQERHSGPIEGRMSPPPRIEPHEEPYVEGVPAPGYEPRAIDNDYEPGAPQGEAAPQPGPMQDEFEPGSMNPAPEGMVAIAPGGPSVPKN